MKRPMPWSDEEDNSSEESSSSHSDSDADDGSGKKNASFRSKAGRSSKEKDAAVKPGKRKSTAVDFDSLKRHGYKGGPSVLNVPPPKEDEKKDWSWSNGKETHENRDIEESYEERQKTRAALNYGEQLQTVPTKEKKNMSFSQKEKRKRELGQASRGKNYVEEEKRTLRESGIYSGFDT